MQERNMKKRLCIHRFGQGPEPRGSRHAWWSRLQQSWNCDYSNVMLVLYSWFLPLLLLAVLWHWRGWLFSFEQCSPLDYLLGGL